MGIALGTLQALAFRVLGTFFLMLVGVITARSLSVDDRGAFVNTTVVIAIAGSLAASFASAAGFFVSNKGIAAGKVASNSVIFSLAAGLAFLVAGVLLDQLLGGEKGRLALLVGASLFPLMARYAIGGVYLGEGRIARYSLALHGHSYLTVAFLLTWVVLLDHRTVNDAVGAWILAQYISLVLLMLSSPSWWAGLLRRPDFPLIWSFITFGTVTGLAGVVSFLNYRIDQLLVGAIEGDKGAGIYASAVVLAEGIWLFSTAISVASYSRVGSVSLPEAADLTVRAVRHTWITAALGMVAILILANVAIVVVFGSRYEGAANSLRILCIGTALYAPQAVISNYFSVALGRPAISLSLAFLSCVLGAIFSVILIPRLGYAGGAWSTMISYAITSTLSTWIFVRMSHTKARDLLHYRRADFVAYIELARALAAKFTPGNLTGARTKP